LNVPLAERGVVVFVKKRGTGEEKRSQSEKKKKKERWRVDWKKEKKTKKEGG